MEATIEKLKAIASDVRLRILIVLGGGERCVCDIEQALAMSQSRISQHLLKLKNAGLISAVQRGKWKHYSITPAGTAFLRQPLEKLLRAAAAKAPARDDLKRLKKREVKSC